MSFASQAREEIAQRSLQLQKDCCVRAAAYGIACFAKYFDARGLVLQTEQELTARVAEQLFARCGVQGTVLEKPRPSGVVYEFGIREPEQVRRMHELFGTTGSETSLQIDPGLIRCESPDLLTGGSKQAHRAVRDKSGFSIRMAAACCKTSGSVSSAPCSCKKRIARVVWALARAVLPRFAVSQLV